MFFQNGGPIREYLFTRGGDCYMIKYGGKWFVYGTLEWLGLFSDVFAPAGAEGKCIFLFWNNYQR